MNFSAATNYELLSLLFDGFYNEDLFFVAEREEIYEIFCAKGYSDEQAKKIAAAKEIAFRLYGSTGKNVKKGSDVFEILSYMKLLEQEHFVCITLDGAYRVKRMRTISVGILNKTIVHPREVFADAITDRAAAIIIAHNHPSKQTEPSDADIDMTNRLREAGELLGITLLDHIIVAGDSYFSFADNRM